MGLRAILLLSGVLFGRVILAQTPVDIQIAKQLTRGKTLGTCSYSPTEKEKPFLDKLPADEQLTGSAFGKPYRIQGKKGKYVSWFGVVRGISPVEPDEHHYTLLLEQKYFDGLTDCHIMLVAATGSGDFRASLEGSAESIPALSLVRIYGKVVAEENKLPQISAEYMRVWPWLSFTFSDLGAEDHSNTQWAQYCTLCKSGGRIYNPYPTEAYYLAVLGDPKNFRGKMLTSRAPTLVELAEADCHEDESQPKIVAGEGWGPVRIGALPTTVDAILGEGQLGRKYSDVYFKDYAPKGVQVSFENTNNTVHAIYFYDRQRGDENFAVFCGQTDKKVDWQSSVEEVKRAYGQPIAEFSGTDTGGTWNRLAFAGIDFRFENGRMVRIGIPGK
jgi:hypothetical protein